MEEECNEGGDLSTCNQDQFVLIRKYVYQNGVKIIEMAVPKYNERLPLYLAKKRTVLYYFVFYTLY